MWQMTVRTTKQIALYSARVAGHEACEAVQQMYGTSSDLCVRGDKVSFDPDAIPPSSDDYLNEIRIKQPLF